MAPHIPNPLSASGTGCLTVVTATEQDGALYCNNNHAHAALHRVLVTFTGYYGAKFTTFVSAVACVQHQNKEMSKYCTVREPQKQFYTCCQYAATIVSTSGLNSPSRTAVKRTLYSRRMSNALIFQWLIPKQAWLSSGGPSVESPELTMLSTGSTCSTCLQPANGLGC